MVVWIPKRIACISHCFRGNDRFFQQPRSPLFPWCNVVLGEPVAQARGSETPDYVEVAIRKSPPRQEDVIIIDEDADRTLHAKWKKALPVCSSSDGHQTIIIFLDGDCILGGQNQGFYQLCAKRTGK